MNIREFVYKGSHCFKVPAREVSVVNELMEYVHHSCPEVVSGYIGSYFIYNILKWSGIYVIWSVFWFMFFVWSEKIVFLVVLILGASVSILVCLYNLRLYRVLSKASPVCRILDSSSFQRTFPLSDFCYIDNIPIPVRYMREHGNLYLVPFLKNIYVVSISK